jgi:2-polyprenyl-3-methyl-5-hydroxy-6-metoxy-1,4-benzoquinol methylase
MALVGCRMKESARPNLFDTNVVCPLGGERLERVGYRLISTVGRQYDIRDDVPLLFVDEDRAAASAASVLGNLPDDVTHAVQNFYEDAPFPNYNNFDNLATFVRSADISIFARMLREQMPLNANVLEVGCGTGQMSNYLAATTLSRIYATDMTLASLRLGRDFARKNGINGVTFIQMNLFMPAIGPESMDVVIANGVLHHTYDTAKAFMRISRLVKPGGYAIIGLYDWIGRLRTDFRRLLVKAFGERVLALDPYLRRSPSPDKRRAWIRDQYFHPQERKHSMSEVIRWFDEAGFSFVSSIPKIVGTFSENERIFVPQRAGTPFDRLLTEIGMLMTLYGGLGGLFICIGRKRAGSSRE